MKQLVVIATMMEYNYFLKDRNLNDDFLWWGIWVKTTKITVYIHKLHIFIIYISYIHENVEC